MDVHALTSFLNFQTIKAKVLTVLPDTTSPLYPVATSCEDVLIPELIHRVLSPNLLIETGLGQHPSTDRFAFSPSFTFPRPRRLRLALRGYIRRCRLWGMSSQTRRSTPEVAY